MGWADGALSKIKKSRERNADSRLATTALHVHGRFSATGGSFYL